MRPLLVAVVLLGLTGPAVAGEGPPILASWGSWGTGPGQFDNPRDVAIGPNGWVYVTELGTKRVQYFTGAGGYLGEWKGGQRYCEDAFYYPSGIAAAADSGIYLVDRAPCLRKFGPRGEFLSTQMIPGLTGTCRIAFDSAGSLYAVIFGAYCQIRKFDSVGSILMEFHVETPEGIYVATDGSIYVTTTSMNDGPPRDARVLKYAPDGTLLATSSGAPDCLMLMGEAITGDPFGNIVVASYYSHNVVVFSPDLQSHACWSTGGWPMGLAFDSEGSLYVGDALLNQVIKYQYAPPVRTQSRTWGSLKAIYR